MKLLLIDDLVNYQCLIDSRKDDVDYVLFNHHTDTYKSILIKIKEKNQIITDIALIQHATQSNIVSILNSEYNLILNDYNSFQDFKDLLIELKNVARIERFDLLACALYHTIEFQQIIAQLEKDTNIDLRASTNFTGNPRPGISVDWIMESDNIDIRDNYFTNAIENFNDMLLDFTLETTILYEGSDVLTASAPLGTSIFIPYTNQTRTLRIDASGGTTPYKYTLKENNTIITVLENTSNQTFSYDLSNNYLYLGDNVNKVFTISVEDNINYVDISYNVTFEAYPEFFIRVDISNITLQLGDVSSVNAFASGGKPEYLYVWYEISGIQLLPINNLTSKLDLSNDYLYDTNDVLKKYKIIVKDQINDEKSIDINVTYKSYQFITASQNFTEVYLDLSESNQMHIINVSGGKTNNYIYKWYSSSILIDLSAINYMSGSESLLPFTELSSNNPQITSINNTYVSINNFAPFIEGHPRRIIYKAEITDLMNTNQVTLYYSVFYEAFYIIIPCFNASTDILLVGDVYKKISELRQGDVLYNPKNLSTYFVKDVFVKKVDISNNMYNVNGDLLLESAIINYYSIMYDNIKTSQFATLNTQYNNTQQIMYHIFTNEFITRDIFTKNGSQIKSYGEIQKLNPETNQLQNYLLYDSLVGYNLLTFTVQDTLPDYPAKE